MSPPVWVPGQVLAASDVNAWFVPQAVVKPSNTSRASTTTITADPALTVNLAAGALYEVRCMVFYSGVNAGGYLQWNWTAPATGFFVYLATYAIQGGGADQGYSASVAGVELAAGSTGGPAWTSGTGVIWSAYMTGLASGGTGGPLTFNWAQAASNGTATVVQANSYLIAQRLS
jgi:hypothetical protein